MCVCVCVVEKQILEERLETRNRLGIGSTVVTEFEIVLLTRKYNISDWQAIPLDFLLFADIRWRTQVLFLPLLLAQTPLSLEFSRQEY